MAAVKLAGQARFVVIGDVAGALNGWPIMLGARTLHIVPADTSVERVERTARRLGAKPAGEESSADGHRRWVLDTGGELHATLVPPGTCGYRDLVRDAQIMQIAPGVSVKVSSLIDLIRMAESSPDPDARVFVPALWATLQMRRLQAQDA